MKKVLILFLFLFLQSAGFAEHRYPESYYQKQWCSRWYGKQEFLLKDSTRVDCLTRNYAVEFDFAPKWAEAVGQSLYYAARTGKKPAIILILESKRDWKYYNRLKVICPAHGITLWYIPSPDFN